MSALAIPTTAARTRVLIADNLPLILAGIRRTLEHSDGIELIGEAGTAAQVLALIERRRPDLVMLDLDMRGSTGAELIAQIRCESPEVKVVVLSDQEDRSAIDGALAAGANAYIVKTVNPSELPSVIRQVASGVVFGAPARQPGGATAASTPDLTERERTILSAISSGLTTATISRQLWVSEHTIKFHLTNVYRKLGVSNRAGAVRYAIEHGLAN